MELPTGTVTFLFTDIEGSTRLLQELGEGYRAVQDDHTGMMREAIAAGGGTEIRTDGDSVFAAFPTAPGALQAAVAAQRALHAHRWLHGERLRVRMGMHTGEGRLGGGDYLGIDVNRAARIAAAGHGGQVLLSAATRVLAEHDLPEGVSLRDLGEHRLKDLAHPEHLHDLVIEGLPSDFPALKTLEVPTNLPTEVTSFVGREREVAELRALVGEARLLTLTGPGGTGKTRLALRLAREVLSEFRDGAFFVDLSPIRDPAQVLSAIAGSLGVQEDPGRTLLEVVTSSLSGREILLVLDNFEQVEDAAPVVDEIRDTGDRTTVVVTSRARLGLSGEHQFSVPPLAPPDPRSTDPEEVSRSDAVALFVDRARAVRNGFSLTGGNASAVAEICRKLDGLPLAIELAAAQVRVLAPGEIASRLDSHLGSIGSGPRNVPARQRTLRSAIEWSYDLLGSPQRTLFARFSVFVGGATLEAIEAVCNPGRDVGADTLDAVAFLLDHSLLRRIEEPQGSRFIMLETIRQFGIERLREVAEGRDIRERHASFYADMAEKAEPHLGRADREVWLDRLERDNGNLRAALGWCIDADRADVAMRLVAGVWRFWQLRGHIAEGRQLAAAVLALGSAVGSTRARARALLALGSLAYWQDDMEAARRPYEEALELARLLGDRDVIAEALFDLGYVEGVEGNFDAADHLFHESAELKEALGDHLGRAWVNVGRTMVLGLQGRWNETMSLLEEALPTFQEAGDRFGIDNTIGAMAASEYRLGNLDRAEELTRGLMESGPAGISALAVGVATMATIALARGDPARAMRLWGAFEAIKEEFGGGAPMVLLPLGDTREEAAARFDEEVAAALREEGRQMGREEALAYALGRDGSPIRGQR